MPPPLYFSPPPPPPASPEQIIEVVSRLSNTSDILTELPNGTHLWDDSRIVLGALDGDPPTSLRVGLRFSLPVPPGAFIIAAFMSFVIGSGDELSPVSLAISVENTSDALGFPVPDHAGTVEGYLRDRPRGAQRIPWEDVSPAVGQAGMPLPSEDISDLLQDLVSSPLWLPGAHVNVIIEANASNTEVGRREFEGARGRGPELVVFYLPVVDSTHLTEFSIVVEEVHIRREPTQEALVVGYNQDSSQLILEPGYLVGLRFSNIDIPQGATIYDANLELDAFVGSDEFTNVEIYAEAADDAVGLTNGSYLIHRERVGHTVSWLNVRATTFAIGQPLESPDLTALINGVTSRPGWAAGGHINIIINATAGSRTFYHAGVEHGPALQVRFGPPPPPPPLVPP